MKKGKKIGVFVAVVLFVAFMVALDARAFGTDLALSLLMLGALESIVVGGGLLIWGYDDEK